MTNLLNFRIFLRFFSFVLLFVIVAVVIFLKTYHEFDCSYVLLVFAYFPQIYYDIYFLSKLFCFFSPDIPLDQSRVISCNFSLFPLLYPLLFSRHFIYFFYDTSIFYSCLCIFSVIIINKYLLHNQSCPVFFT